MTTTQRSEINAGSLALRADIIHNDPACASRFTRSCECARRERVYVESVKGAAEQAQEEPIRPRINDFGKWGTLDNTGVDIQTVCRRAGDQVAAGIEASSVQENVVAPAVVALNVNEPVCRDRTGKIGVVEGASMNVLPSGRP